jgi:hypothetical protein
VQLHGQPGRAGAAGEGGQVDEARLGRERDRLVLLAQDPEQPAQLGQRLPPRRLHGGEGECGAVGVVLGQAAGPARLDGHRRQRVGYHVVQLARDAGPLLQRGGLRPPRPLLLGVRGLLPQGAVEPRAVAHELAEQHRRGGRQGDDEDEVAQLVRVAVDSAAEHCQAGDDQEGGGEPQALQSRAGRVGHEQHAEVRASGVLGQRGPDDLAAREGAGGERHGEQGRAPAQRHPGHDRERDGDGQGQVAAAQPGDEEQLDGELDAQQGGEQRVEPVRRQRAQIREQRAEADRSSPPLRPLGGRRWSRLGCERRRG